MFFDNWYGILRVVVVGPLAYIALIVMLRASGKRTLSRMNAFDFIVTIALGSTLASIILTNSVALLEGVVGLAMLIVLQYVITWLSVRSDMVARLVKDEPSLLYHRGRYLDGQLKHTRVTRSEVQAAVRQQGHGTMDEVGSVVLETDGTFTVTNGEGRPVGVPKPQA